VAPASVDIGLANCKMLRTVGCKMLRTVGDDFLEFLIHDWGRGSQWCNLPHAEQCRRIRSRDALNAAARTRPASSTAAKRPRTGPVRIVLQGGVIAEESCCCNGYTPTPAGSTAAPCPREPVPWTESTSSPSLAVRTLYVFVLVLHVIHPM
jgi:hypothetical protein